MYKIYGKENIQLLENDLLDNPKAIVSGSSSLYAYSYRDRTLFPLTPNAVINEEREVIVPMPKARTLPTKGDTIYVHPNCTIPRALLNACFKKTLQPLNADYCVIPDNTKDVEAYYMVLFKNENTGKYYFFIDTRNKISSELKGAPLKDFSKAVLGSNAMNHITEEFNNAMESKLVFSGEVMAIHDKDYHIWDIACNKLCNVITERDVFKILETADRDFTLQNIQQFSEMLKSKEPDTVTTALRTMSFMDYDKYKNTVITVLKNSFSNWYRNKTKYLTSVSYMIKKLQISNGYAHYSNSITPEDYALFVEINEINIKKAIQEVVDDVIAEFPFIDITFSEKHTITPKLPSNVQEQDMKNCENSDSINND